MSQVEESSAIPIPWNGPAEFPSRLRGVRHLKRLSVARLRVGDEKQLYDSFFTLHEDFEAAELSKPFYSSEVVYASTHPQWCMFNETQFRDPPAHAQKKLVVCVWEVGEAELPRRLLLKVRVDLSELCFISTLALDFPYCTLLFELQDGLYTTANVRQQLEENGIIIRRDAYADEENSKRYSCSRSAYIDIISKKRDLMAKKQRIAQLTQQIQQKKTENSTYLERLEARNELEGRLASLKAQFDILNATYLKKKQELEAKANILIPTAEQLKAAQLALATSMQEMEQRRIELVAHHQQLTKTFFLIRKHQERLIRDLANVYRILPVRDTSGSSTRSYVSSATGSSNPHSSSILYSINGCELNNSHFHGQDEEKIATGLGYVCHLVQLLSKYLDIPLRYPMSPMMSRSTIQDVVVSSDRFPLYSKAQSIDQFRTAVALLNRNVEQLVLSQGLEPGPLRETLPNLRRLLDHFISPLHATSSAPVASSSSPPSVIITPTATTTNFVPTSFSTTSSTPTNGSNSDTNISPSPSPSPSPSTTSPTVTASSSYASQSPSIGRESPSARSTSIGPSQISQTTTSPQRATIAVTRPARRGSESMRSTLLEEKFVASRATVQMTSAEIVDSEDVNLTSSDEAISAPESPNGLESES